MTDPEEPDTALVEEIHENGVVKPDGDSEESTPDTNPPGPARKTYVKKYPKPDDTQLKRECEALSSQIEQHKSKIEEIKQLIGSKSESRRSGGGAQQQVRAKLADLRQQFQAELVRAYHIGEQSSALVTTGWGSVKIIAAICCFKEVYKEYLAAGISA